MSARIEAHSAVRRAIRAKTMKPARMLLCVDCGSRALDYDHRDYAEPLIVEPVCRSCNLLRGPAKNSDRGAYEATAFGGWLALQPRGTGTSIAVALGVPRPLIVQWGKGIRAIPVDRCPHIELATLGEVTAEELRPDIAWVRVKDRKWPGGRGRPALDFMGDAAVPA